MKITPWLLFGAVGVGAILAGACGGDDSGGGGTDGDTTSGGGTASSTTNPNTTNSTTRSSTSTTGRPSTTTSTSTTGAGGGGSGGEGGGAGAGGEGGMGGEAPARPSCDEIDSRAFGDDAEDFTISSPDFDFCKPMPAETTCDGKLFPESVSPELSWTEGPEGTESYAITFTDLTILETRDPSNHALYNQGYHYVIWNIPADTLSLPAELGSGYEVPGIEGALQWAPFNYYGYMGPCPNMPDVEPPLNDDTYSFTIYALDVATLPIPAVDAAGPSFPRLMDDYLRANAIAAAEYRGTSDAQASSIEGVFPPMFDVPCPSEGEEPAGCLAAD